MSPSPAISLRGVDHDDPLAEIVGEDPGGLAQHRRLADAGPAHDQDRLPALDEVVDDLDRSVDGPPDPACQADDLAGPIANRADPVQGPLDPGPIVVTERPDVIDDVGDVGLGDLAVEEHHLAIREARLRPPTQVEDDLDQRLLLGESVDGRHDLGRQRREQRVQVVDRFATAIRWSHARLLRPAQRTPAGTSAGSATRTRVSFMSSVTVAIVSNPASSSRRSIGDSYVLTGTMTPWS